jgi:hypothetical protein
MPPDVLMTNKKFKGKLRIVLPLLPLLIRDVFMWPHMLCQLLPSYQLFLHHSLVVYSMIEGDYKAPLHKKLLPNLTSDQVKLLEC